MYGLSFSSSLEKIPLKEKYRTIAMAGQLVSASSLMSAFRNERDTNAALHIAKGTANMEGRVKTIMRTGDN